MVCTSERSLSLSLLVEKLRHEWRPDRDGIGRVDKEMPIATERRYHMIFDLAAGRGESLVHAFGQGWAKEGVVLDIDPQHRHPRRATELTRCFHQLVRRAIVVGLAIDATATAGGEGDDRFDRRWVQA